MNRLAQKLPTNHTESEVFKGNDNETGKVGMWESPECT